MLVKVNCESNCIESADTVAALFTHGTVFVDRPRAVKNSSAQNGVTFVLVLYYADTIHENALSIFVNDGWNFCASRKQDCIAYRIFGGKGDLCGPRPEKYTPFNPAYFIE